MMIISLYRFEKDKRKEEKCQPRHEKPVSK